MGSMSTQTITEFLEARIAEDEAVAREAIATDRPGTHWHWVATKTDAVVAAGDLAEAQEYQPVSLRTVEEFPTSSGVGDLPGFVVSYAEEVDPGAGEHIARHYPARVLAECAAKRAIVSHYTETVKWARDPDCPAVQSYTDIAVGLGESLHHLAAVYADHAEFQQEWKL